MKSPIERTAALEPDTDKAHEHVHGKGHEIVAAQIDALVFFALRHADELAVQSIRPMMVGAGDPAGAMSGVTVEQPCRTMAANIVKGADLTVLAADDKDSFA